MLCQIAKVERPGGEDDIYAPSLLPILRSRYYRDILGEHGAFFALAKGIDRIHKNAWIGFQSWRLMTQKVLFCLIDGYNLYNNIP